MLRGIIYEYIWIDGYGELRSKTRIIHKPQTRYDEYKQELPPYWNYDGSSTGQAKLGENTEITLCPVFVCTNPLRRVEEYASKLVLCETFHVDGQPTETNTRRRANLTFDKARELVPWFGLEQEYYMLKHNVSGEDNHGWGLDNSDEGKYYCGIYNNGIQRKIVEEHMEACLAAGLHISGVNAEVSPQQWEFQVGPCVGVSAGDEMMIAKYLLQKIAEKYDITINYSPKLCRHLSGSGCHINFSTTETRNPHNGDGLNTIYRYVELLRKAHAEHIDVYGKGNERRLTGLHETAHISEFSCGVGTRNTSVRIPNQCEDEGCGYLEDRRPAANIDHYVATAKIFETCCLGKYTSD